MKSTEYAEFTRVVNSVLSVSREEMKRREAAYRAMTDANPNKRGPKKGTKRKPKQAPASRVPDASLPS